MTNRISEDQWRFYEENGYVNLGKIVNDADLAALGERINDIMLGKAKLDYDQILMQLDSESGNYEDTGKQSLGHKGARLDYRKIQELEHDPLFLAFMQRPIFRDICARVYGQETPISSFRAMFMNKPAHKGSYLPWHQDRWNFLDIDPLLTVWTALDPATVANGCVQIIPRSHKLGLINPDHQSGFLTKEQAARHCPREKAEYLELQAGEVALLHNWLLHSSDVNKTDIPRRAFSVSYMDARTQNKKGKNYPVVFGEGAISSRELQPA